MVDVFHVFGVLDVFQTYSMFSHLGWQDSKICEALRPGWYDLWLVGHNFDLSPNW